MGGGNMPAGIPGEVHVMIQEPSFASMLRVSVNRTLGAIASATCMAVLVCRVGSEHRMTLMPRAMAMYTISWSCIHWSTQAPEVNVVNTSLAAWAPINSADFPFSLTAVLPKMQPVLVSTTTVMPPPSPTAVSGVSSVMSRRTGTTGLMSCTFGNEWQWFLYR